MGQVPASVLREGMADGFANLGFKSRMSSPRVEIDASDWVEYRDEDGRRYYYCEQTNESSWDPPPGWAGSDFKSSSDRAEDDASVALAMSVAASGPALGLTLLVVLERNLPAYGGDAHAPAEVAIERAICGATAEELRAVDQYGDTAIHLCCRRGAPELVELCLARGADASAAGAAGCAPLHTVATKLRGTSRTRALRATASPEIARALLRAGADVNSRCGGGAGPTALMLAAATGNVWLAHVLLEHGADDALADGAGLDARAHADTSGETEMHKLLTQHRRACDAQAARDRSGGLDHERNAFLEERRQFLRLHALFYGLDHNGAGALGAAELNELLRQILGIAPGLSRMMHLVAHARDAQGAADAATASNAAAKLSPRTAAAVGSTGVSRSLARAQPASISFGAFFDHIFDPFLQGRLELLDGAGCDPRATREAERCLQDVLDNAEVALAQAEARKAAAERERALARNAADAADAAAVAAQSHASLSAEDRAIALREADRARRYASEILTRKNREVAAAEAERASALARTEATRAAAEHCMLEMEQNVASDGAMAKELAAALRVARDAAVADAAAARSERDAARAEADDAAAARDAAVAVASAAQPTTADAAVTLGDDPRYATFFRMLASGMPKADVARAMADAGADPKLLDMSPDFPVEVVERARALVADEHASELATMRADAARSTDARVAAAEAERETALGELRALHACERDAAACDAAAREAALASDAAEREKSAVRAARESVAAELAAARADAAAARADAADAALRGAAELEQIHAAHAAELDARIDGVARALADAESEGDGTGREVARTREALMEKHRAMLKRIDVKNQKELAAQASKGLARTKAAREAAEARAAEERCVRENAFAPVLLCLTCLSRAQRGTGRSARARDGGATHHARGCPRGGDVARAFGRRAAAARERDRARAREHGARRRRGDARGRGGGDSARERRGAARGRLCRRRGRSRAARAPHARDIEAQSGAVGGR